MGIHSTGAYDSLALLMRPFSHKWRNLKNIANDCSPHMEKQWILTNFDDNFSSTLKSIMVAMVTVYVTNYYYHITKVKDEKFLMMKNMVGG